MSRTLFLADDSVTIQRVVELTFAHEDIRVVSVGDGRKAVQWLESEKPDIVLLDVELPELSGFDVAARVRKSPRLRHVPILLLAGAFEGVDEERARKVGTDGVVNKPFEPEQLVARVKELLASAPPSRPEPTRAGGLRQAPAVGTAASDPVAAPAVVTMPRAMEMETPAVKRVEQPMAAAGGGGGGYTPDPPLRSVPGFPGLTQAPAPPPEPLEPPTRPIWETGPAAPQHARPAEPRHGGPSAGQPKVSLSNAFSALLAAEQTSPAAAPAQTTAVIISESAIEDAVRRVLAKMTDEMVQRIVLDTAERLIREELEKIRQEPE
jgi:DNA-binding response OmpR family regulator